MAITRRQRDRPCARPLVVVDPDGWVLFAHPDPSLGGELFTVIFPDQSPVPQSGDTPCREATGMACG